LPRFNCDKGCLNDERFASDEYVYGIEPNQFLMQNVSIIPKGGLKIMLNNYLENVYEKILVKINSTKCLKILFVTLLFVLNFSISITVENTDSEIIVTTDRYTVKILLFDGKIESLKLHGSDFEIVSQYINYSIFFPEYRFEHDGSSNPFFDCPDRKSTKYQTRIIYQDDSSVLIKVPWKTECISSEWYYLFEDGKPWFSSSITRTVDTEGVYSNFQQCVMYNPDVDNSYIINYDGQIELTMGNYDGVYPWVSPQKDGVNYNVNVAQHSMWTHIDYGDGKFFPTMAWTDDESGICMGAITTYTSPNQRESISYHGGGRVHSYAEGQWNWFGKSDSESLYLKKGTTFSMNLIFYQNKTHIDSLFSFVELLKSDYFESIEPVNYTIASWGGRTSPLDFYYWRFPQVTNNTINSQELWRHKGFSVPRSQIGTNDSQLFSFDMFYSFASDTVNVSPIYGLEALFTSNEIQITDSSSTGTMRWNESGIESELSYTAFNNRNDINISGAIYKQTSGKYFIELKKSPRTSGYIYNSLDNLLTIYSLDSVLDTVAITLKLEKSIVDIDFNFSSDQIILYISENSPTFSIDMVSSIGQTIHSSGDFKSWAKRKFPEYQESYLKFDKDGISFKPSENYLIREIEPSSRFLVYATDSFSELHINSVDYIHEVEIISIHDTTVATINRGGEYKNIPYSFEKDQIYDLSLMKYNRTPIDSIELFTITNHFPNPVSDLLKLEVFSLNEIMIEFELYNILGELCYSNEFHCDAGLNSIEISLNSFASGMYLLNAKNAATLQTKKIIVVK